MHSVAESPTPGSSTSRSEVTALVAGCGMHRADTALFTISGRDRTRWLNGMVTNNIRDLEQGRGVYAFVLNAQGQILGDLYVFNHGESLVAEIERSQVDKVLQILRRYIIMDKVEITELPETEVISVIGPRSAETLSAAGLQKSLGLLEFTDLTWNDGSLTLARGDNRCFANYEVWVSKEEAPRVWQALAERGAVPVSDDSVETFRILCGIPKVGPDIRERTLPQETGQERALNFNKGCYIGQEIVERIRARGAVHKAFTGFHIEGPVPEPGTRIQAAGKDVGEITTVTSAPLRHMRMALGFLRKEAASEVLTAGQATVKAVALPFTGIFD